MGVSLRFMSLPFVPTSWSRMVDRIVTTDHNVPRSCTQIIMYPAWTRCYMYAAQCSSGIVCTIKFNVFHFGLPVSFYIANLRLKISGNKVTPGESHENLHPVKFPMYTCMHVYLKLPSSLPFSLHMYLHKVTSAHTSCGWTLVSWVWCSDSSDFEFWSHVSLQNCLQLLINLD